MGKILTDYQVKLDQILQEKAGDLSQEDKDSAVADAVSEHSRLRPQEKVNDIVGSGVFDLALPADWEKGFSKILAVEFPADQREPSYLEDEDWFLYEKPTGQALRLRNDTPTAAQKVRITYTVRHKVDISSGTIPDADFDAVCHFAAAFACQALANRYSQLSESTLGADSVDHRSKALEYRSGAGAERKIYFNHLGLKESEHAIAGMAFKDLDENYPWGEDRLTHPRRWR